MECLLFQHWNQIECEMKKIPIVPQASQACNTCTTKTSPKIHYTFLSSFFSFLLLHHFLHNRFFCSIPNASCILWLDLFSHFLVEFPIYSKNLVKPLSMWVCGLFQQKCLLRNYRQTKHSRKLEQKTPYNRHVNQWHNKKKLYPTSI